MSIAPSNSTHVFVVREGTDCRSTEQLDEIPYVDRPDIELPAASNNRENEAHPSETVSMPFKYVKGPDGKPVMPKVVIKLNSVISRD